MYPVCSHGVSKTHSRERGKQSESSVGVWRLTRARESILCVCDGIQVCWCDCTWGILGAQGADPSARGYPCPWWVLGAHRAHPTPGFPWALWGCGITSANPCHAQRAQGSGLACPSDPTEMFPLRLSTGHFPALAQKKDNFFFPCPVTRLNFPSCLSACVWKLQLIN